MFFLFISIILIAASSCDVEKHYLWELCCVYSVQYVFLCVLFGLLILFVSPHTLAD